MSWTLLDLVGPFFCYGLNFPNTLLRGFMMTKWAYSFLLTYINTIASRALSGASYASLQR